MEKRISDFKTYDTLSLLSAQMKEVLLASLFACLLLCIALALPTFLAVNPGSARTLWAVALFFLANLAGGRITQIALQFQYKRGWTRKPPFTRLLFGVVGFTLFLLLLPHKLPPAYQALLLLVASCGVALLWQQAYYYLFIQGILFLLKRRPAKILNQPAFVEALAQHFKLTRQAKDNFCLLLISFTLPLASRKKMKKSIMLSLFFNLLKRNIRSSDQLGVILKGRVAAIISGKNQKEGALLQATRLLTILQKHRRMAALVAGLRAEWKYVVCSYGPQHPDGESMLLQATRELKEVLVEEVSRP